MCCVDVVSQVLSTRCRDTLQSSEDRFNKGTEVTVTIGQLTGANVATYQRDLFVVIRYIAEEGAKPCKLQTKVQVRHSKP